MTKYHGKPAKFELVDGIKDPNKVLRKQPDLLAEPADAPSCEFLGQTFPEGKHINYGGQDYICQGGHWVKD